MLKKFAFAFVGLIIVFGIIGAIKKKQFTPPPPYEMPPESVTTGVVEAQEWERVVAAVGSLRADQGVIVPSEGQGTVKRIAFESGALVQAGDVLIELDSEVERAQLASAQSRAELSQINLNRARELWERQAISKSDFDTAEASFKQTTADAQSLAATIAKKVMRAPFTGRTGIRLVSLGQFLDRGNPMVTLQALNPIHADFSLPQQRISEIKAGFPVRVTLDAKPGVVFTGKVSAISPEIDSTTRTARVESTLANADEQLTPGMYVNVEVVAPEKTAVVAIPATAVYFQPFGDTIFVVKSVKDEATGQVVKRAEQRFVKLGEARGDYVRVISGVNAGEEVVTSGVFKLSNGTKLFVDNSLAPKPELAPKPNNS